MIYLSLFYEFFKAGLFAVGGGLATIPFMKEIALKTGWFTLSQLTDMIAVSESTPGPMGVNCATYVGYETAGLLGGVIATLGLIAPSIIIIIIISKILEKFRNNRFVDAAFFGLRAASVALIAEAGVSVAELTFIIPGATVLEMINYKGIILAFVILYFIQSIVVIVMLQICKLCIIGQPRQFHRTDRAVSLLGNDDFCHIFSLRIMIVIIITVNKHHYIRVLLDCS